MLKLRRGVTYEFIATFYVDDKPWATPLGAQLLDERHLRLRVYSGTTTFKAVTRGVDIVLNVTFNPWLYLITAFKQYYRDSYSKLQFDTARRVYAPTLRGASAHIEATCVYNIDYATHCEAVYKIVHVEVRDRPLLEPLTRLYVHLIDIVIYLTKVRALDLKDSEKFVNLLEEEFKLVDRICREEYCKEFINEARRLLNQLLNSRSVQLSEGSSISKSCT